MTTHIQPNWPAPPTVRAYTTLRNAFGPQPITLPSVEGEQMLKSLLALPSSPIWLKQTHGAVAVEALPGPLMSADAAFTRVPSRICLVITADCLPILICNRQGTEVAAIHAGWRGLASGVIESTLKQLTASAEDLLVWLGPAIGPQKFEVGEDVYTAFVTQHEQSASAFHAIKSDKWLADLYYLARLRLNLCGVKQIYGGDFCTFTQKELFFSYRREQKQTGRMVSLIWMTAH